jgi:hypothetical protein
MSVLIIAVMLLITVCLGALFLAMGEPGHLED